ncbi:hypothetical protein DPMN_006278 [Dreissena polymorpha]|uniref:PDZ domain-containing protein n=1 Tax=Dreissena polymorpha TaxID=45954 RepID=A0A9D4RXC1_DREPO|nr:hypothetical protein DPMN_006278 [Dreissena polymorpha]
MLKWELHISIVCFEGNAVRYIRHHREQLGFNIRGGKEHNCGIFVSKVMQNSEAEKLGLQEGDQFLSVNDDNFEYIDHGEVGVAYVGMGYVGRAPQVRYFPYGYNRTYDKSGHNNPDSPQPAR